MFLVSNGKQLNINNNYSSIRNRVAVNAILRTIGNLVQQGEALNVWNK